jgi:hypothetical protein
MKSIMEEASSIFKAIENAWKRAGQPQDFSVKVFEEPQRNFFGLTVKSAKIGLFFDEKSLAKTKVTPPANPKPKIESQPKPQQEKPVNQKKSAPQKNKESMPPKKTPAPTQPKPVMQPKAVESSESIWSPDMVKAAQEWMRTTLSYMNMSHVNFSITLSKYYIHFNFDSKLFGNTMKEKSFFRSCAYLIMTSLRNKFKKEFRGLKVVLSS